jgi:tetrahydromethanopterin S-methyltransferase subunit G
LKFRIGALQTSVPHLQTVLTHHSKQFDQVNARLGRIERRLDLVDAD